MKCLKLTYAAPLAEVSGRSWKDLYLKEHSRYKGVTIFRLRTPEIYAFDIEKVRFLHHRWAIVKVCPRREGSTAPSLHRIYRYRTLAEARDTIGAFHDKLKFL